MNNVFVLLRASSANAATPATSSTSSMSSSRVSPMTPIAMSQAMNFTPAAFADLISAGRDMMFCFFMTSFIIAVPMPDIFIFESVSFSAPFGSIQPNIREMKFFRTAGDGFFRKTERPQNVKKIPTSAPDAASPFAKIIAASALSRSLLKRTIATECGEEDEDEG